MQESSYLVLAQSGRFLAQQLQFTGCPIWVADCFGDDDTLTACSRWLPLTSLDDSDTIHSLIRQIPRDQTFHLICGSGVEHFYPYLNKLPSNIRLIGNSVDTVRQIKTPELFFKQLDQLKLPYPETQFIEPEEKPSWLLKSAHGLGGTHIHHLDESPTSSDSYFQQYHAGKSGSALVIANGESSQLLSLNRHYHSPMQEMPFRLGAIDNSLTLNTKQQQTIEAAIETLTKHYALLGLNSIDFIIDEDEDLFITEINPRPTASVELLAETINPLQLHIQACQGQLPPIEPILDSNHKACLIYHFAPQALTISSNIIWPDDCYDIPRADTEINYQQIVCTSVIKNCHYNGRLQLERDNLIFNRFE